jgi:hypothetical protein
MMMTCADVMEYFLARERLSDERHVSLLTAMLKTDEARPLRKYLTSDDGG